MVAVPAALACPDGYTRVLYSDVADSDAYAYGIYHVQVWGGAASGGEFRPGRAINRAEAVSMLTRIWYLGCSQDLSNPNIPAPYFTDVRQSDWFASAACGARENGVIGDSAEFRAAGVVRLADAAKMLVEARNLPVRPAAAGADWWAPYLAAISEQGAIPATVLTPDQVLTRAEFAEMAYRLNSGRNQKEARVWLDGQLQLRAAVENPNSPDEFPEIAGEPGEETPVEQVSYAAIDSTAPLMPQFVDAFTRFEAALQGDDPANPDFVSFENMIKPADFYELKAMQQAGWSEWVSSQYRSPSEFAAVGLALNESQTVAALVVKGAQPYWSDTYKYNLAYDSENLYSIYYFVQVGGIWQLARIDTSIYETGYLADTIPAMLRDFLSYRSFE